MEDVLNFGNDGTENKRVSQSTKVSLMTRPSPFHAEVSIYNYVLNFIAFRYISDGLIVILDSGFIPSAIPLGEPCGSCFCPPTYTAGTCAKGLSCKHDPRIADAPGRCVNSVI